jgi:hypothetical protein
MPTLQVAFDRRVGIAHQFSEGTDDASIFGKIMFEFGIAGDCWKF